MVNRDAVRAWIEGYVRAWNSNERDDIVRLFTEDARYFTEPHAQPWVGHDGIVEGWLGSKDEPGDTTFEFDVLAVEGALAVVKGETRYKGSGKHYSNLWEITFADDGRATNYVEWWMER